VSGYEVPLLISAIAFFAFLVFKMRPAIGRHGREHAAALKEANDRIAKAPDDAAKANALCDAGDALVRLGRLNGAVGYYLRALRANPKSKDIVERTATGLAKRPGQLENLLWRQLGAVEWKSDAREAQIAALRALGAVYAKRPRHQHRAKAVEHALEALGPE
jgi:tetratricopeptide (TPR) repeat protein